MANEVVSLAPVQQDVAWCANTYNGERCIWLVDHDGPAHQSRSGLSWPAHVPHVPEPSVADLKAEIERLREENRMLVAHSRAQSRTIRLLICDCERG